MKDLPIRSSPDTSERLGSAQQITWLDSEASLSPLQVGAHKARRGEAHLNKYLTAGWQNKLRCTSSPALESPNARKPWTSFRHGKGGAGLSRRLPSHRKKRLHRLLAEQVLRRP